MISFHITRTTVWMAAGALLATFAAAAQAGDPVRRSLDLRFGHQGLGVRFRIVDGHRVRTEVRVSNRRAAERHEKPACTADRCVHPEGRDSCESTACRTTGRHESRTAYVHHTRHHGHGHGHGKKAAAFDGWMWLNRGRYLHAVRAFERSLDRHPHRASQLVGLAIGQLALGDRSAAAAAMRRAVLYDADVLACDPVSGVDRALIGRLLHNLEHAADRCRTGEIRFLQAALNGVEGRYHLAHRRTHLARAAGDLSVSTRRLQGWLHRKMHPPVHRGAVTDRHRPVHRHVPRAVPRHSGRHHVVVGHGAPEDRAGHRYASRRHVIHQTVLRRNPRPQHH